MIGPLRNSLSHKLIILASGSPRRTEILKGISFNFQTIPSTFEENLNPDNYSNSYEFAIETAKQKAIEVFFRLANNVAKEPQKIPDLVIGADTIVTFENKVYGKPKNKEDAFDMLSKFSGKKHKVYTGIALVTPSKNPELNEKYDVKTFYECTEVLFGSLTPEIIHDYIETGEPMDKAGGYGIQGYGGSLIEGIVGDYYNVMGFPLHRFCKELLSVI